MWCQCDLQHIAGKIKQFGGKNSRNEKKTESQGWKKNYMNSWIEKESIYLSLCLSILSFQPLYSYLKLCISKTLISFLGGKLPKLIATPCIMTWRGHERSECDRSPLLQTLTRSPDNVFFLISSCIRVVSRYTGWARPTKCQKCTWHVPDAQDRVHFTAICTEGFKKMEPAI